MVEVSFVRVLRLFFLFIAGGLCYMGIECLWRGWTHGTMFLAGGSCFLLLGKLDRTTPRLSLIPRAFLGATVITGVELLIGMVANVDYSIWDYRDVPANFHGQICLPFFLLWMPLSLGAMWLYRVVRNIIPMPRCRERKDRSPSS